MQINIKLLKEEALLTLKKNPQNLFEQISSHPNDSCWLKTYLGFEPYEIKMYKIEDFELRSSENYEEVALENGITLFEHLRHLPRYILCDFRFWLWITFEKAYKQAISASPLTPSIVNTSWIPSSGSRRDLLLGIVSRGYFRTEMTYDATAADPYTLTKYLASNTGELYRGLVYRNFSNVKEVTLGLIEAAMDAENASSACLSRESIRTVMKIASKMGSIMLIDNMDRKEVYDYLYPKMLKILSSPGQQTSLLTL